MDVAMERRRKSQNFSPDEFRNVVWPNHESYREKLEQIESFCRAPLVPLNGTLSEEEVAKNAQLHIHLAM